MMHYSTTSAVCLASGGLVGQNIHTQEVMLTKCSPSVCKLVCLSGDVHIYSSSGMRRDTYLEFNRRLKIKRRSDFTIDFKTTEQDGVIFYTADERDIDFIALFLKGGQVSELKCT